MAASIFALIDGMKGETSVADYKDHVEVNSLNLGIHQPTSATASSSGGGTTERAELRDVVFTKSLDKTSPEFAKMCTEGKHIKSVAFKFNRAAGDAKNVVYYMVELENCVISNYTVGSQGAGVPSEEIALNFGKIKWTYEQQARAGGGGAGKVVAGWDLEGWKAWA